MATDESSKPPTPDPDKMHDTQARQEADRIEATLRNTREGYGKAPPVPDVQDHPQGTDPNTRIDQRRDR
jgi:hypothetical protein